MLDGIIGEPIEFTFLGFEYTIQGGVRPYVYELTSSDGKPLPDGLALDTSSGRITGTPTELFSKTVQLSITDAGGKRASGNVLVAITEPLEVKMPDTITYYVGQTVSSYDYAPEIIGGENSSFMYEIEVDGGQLPDGLSFEAWSGTIVGTPTTEATFKFRIAVTDMRSWRTYYSNEVSASVEKPAPPAFEVKLPSSMTVKLNQSVSVISEITVSSGDGSNAFYSYNLEVNGVLDGKSLLPTGLSSSLPYSNFGKITVIYGTARQTGVYKIRVLATDQYENRESHFSNEMTLTIEP